MDRGAANGRQGTVVGAAFFCPILAIRAGEHTRLFVPLHFPVACSDGTVPLRANILWIGNDVNAVTLTVQATFPEAEFVGEFTSGSFLFAPYRDPLKILGLPIVINSLTRGPIASSGKPVLGLVGGSRRGKNLPQLRADGFHPK